MSLESELSHMDTLETVNKELKTWMVFKSKTLLNPFGEIPQDPYFSDNFDEDEKSLIEGLIEEGKKDKFPRSVVEEYLKENGWTRSATSFDLDESLIFQEWIKGKGE